MPLNNIHVWVDDEVITHDDLNSVGEAVSQATSTGAILPTQLVWPFVAQGDIDLNGFSIRNMDALSGFIHVNDSLTLADAVAAATTGTVIVIDPDAVSPATATDILITGKSDVTIFGYGGARISVGSACATAGITISNSCTNVKIIGIKFTGGTAGKPAVNIDGSVNSKVQNCWFETILGCVIGSAASNTVTAEISGNYFTGTPGNTAIRVKSMQLSKIIHNTFVDNESAIVLPGDGDGSVCNYNVISHNVFQYFTFGISSDWSGVVDGSRGYNTISDNIFFVASGVDAIAMYGYYRDKYSDNQFNGTVTISGDYNRITDNTCVNNLVVNGAFNVVKDNAVYGSFTITTASAVSLGKTMVVGNEFHGASTMDSKVQWYEGNMFYTMPTVSGSDAYTDLSNWRKT
jgi:hypothetical protein